MIFRLEEFLSSFYILLCNNTAIIEKWYNFVYNYSEYLSLFLYVGYEALLCLEHYQWCKCCPAEEQILLYRYGLDELSQFIERPQARLHEYQLWKDRVTNFFQAESTLRGMIKNESRNPESQTKSEVQSE